jgi:hypothetical protein
MQDLGPARAHALPFARGEDHRPGLARAGPRPRAARPGPRHGWSPGAARGRRVG